MKIDILELVEDDIEGILDLNYIFMTETDHYSKLGYSREKFKKVLSIFTLPGNGCVVAKVDGLIVGYSPYRIDMDYIDKINFEIMTFYVHPDFRNTGVGGAIIDRLVELMEDFGASYSHISICAQFKEQRELIQKATERLFRRRGFEQIGVVMGRDLTKNETGH